MLEVLYDIATKEGRAWNADMSVKGNLRPKEGQRVYTFPIDPPDFESDIYYVDFVNKRVVGNPDYIPPVSPKSLEFTPENAALGVEQRIKHIEEFLIDFTRR